MPDSRNKDAERRAEAAFNLQQAQVRQQQEFLTQETARNEQILNMLQNAQVGNEEIRNLALASAEEAFEGRPSPALESLFRQQQERTSEVIRRNLGVGGETSTPGIERQQALDEAQAVATEQNRLQNIAGTVGAFDQLNTGQLNNIARILNVQGQRLGTSQVLGQNIANLGKLSQFNVPRDTFARDLGQATISGLASQPSAFQNIKGNVAGITRFLRGPKGGVPFVPFI